MEKPIPRLPAVSVNAIAGGWQVVRGDKPVQTPARHDLVLRTQALAIAVADEWRAQKTRQPDPAQMPLTSLAVTIIDRVSDARRDLLAGLLDFVASDLCCYRVELPPDLAAVQGRHWDPVLDFTAARYGMRPGTTTGLSVMAVDPILVAAIERDLAALSDDDFGVLQVLTVALGSVFLALALQQGHIDVDAAIAAHFCEEDYYEGVAGAAEHGADPILKLKRTNLTRDVHDAMRYAGLAALK